MTNRLRATTVSITDTGRVRARNEDRLLITERLFAVADGMGGHTLGDVAATCAIDALKDALPELESERERGEHESTITAGLMRAADEICRYVDGDPRGTTSTSVLHIGKAAGTTIAGVYLAREPIVFHVGDSRVYRYRGGEMARLTRDHSLVQEMVDAGEITDAQAHVHPRKNIITRAIGTYGPPRVEFAAAEFTAGDYVLVCSDGLHDELTDEEISDVLRRASTIEQAVEELRDAALAAGGHDNVSIVLAQIGE